MSKIVVTGASGVLGSAVYDAFRNSGCHATGLAHSRPTTELRQLDLLDEDKVANLAIELHLGRGDWIVHCAAERRPDVAQKVPLSL
jgi:S-adenosylmethionine synthetase